MSDIREFPMQPPADDAEQRIEIRPLEVWPFLEQQWERQRKQQRDQQMERTIIEWLRGCHVNQ